MKSKCAHWLKFDHRLSRLNATEMGFGCQCHSDRRWSELSYHTKASYLPRFDQWLLLELTCHDMPWTTTHDRKSPFLQNPYGALFRNCARICYLCSVETDMSINRIARMARFYPPHHDCQPFLRCIFSEIDFSHIVAAVAAATIMPTTIDGASIEIEIALESSTVKLSLSILLFYSLIRICIYYCQANWLADIHRITATRCRIN